MSECNSWRLHSKQSIWRHYSLESSLSLVIKGEVISRRKEPSLWLWSQPHWRARISKVTANKPANRTACSSHSWLFSLFAPWSRVTMWSTILALIHNFKWSPLICHVLHLRLYPSIRYHRSSNALTRLNRLHPNRARILILASVLFTSLIQWHQPDAFLESVAELPFSCQSTPFQHRQAITTAFFFLVQWNGSTLTQEIITFVITRMSLSPKTASRRGQGVNSVPDSMTQRRVSPGCSRQLNIERFMGPGLTLDRWLILFRLGVQGIGEITRSGNLRDQIKDHRSLAVLCSNFDFHWR